MDAILVSGDFHEAYNLLAIISLNPTKPSPIHYVIGEENGNPPSFTAYIMELISSRWFEHGNALILDNAAIHLGGEAGNVKDYLWDTVLLYWSNPVSQVLRAMAFKRTTRGRSNFGELMTAKIS
jgi:hypothetical protein